LINVLNTHLYAQTITLFRYFMLGILNRRLFGLLSVLLVVAFLVSGFVYELAIINSREIAIALLADFLRYSMALLILLLITSNIAEDFENRQFGRLLTMPISRWQYVTAQVLVVSATSIILVLPAFLVSIYFVSVEIAIYWTVALWLELLLVGLIGFLAILSLEKVPLAVFLALAIYVLSKLSVLISQMLAESVRLSDGELANRFAASVFAGILHLLPGLESFAQNDVFFEKLELISVLGTQFQTVFIYAIFIIMACLVDFYRKEFNL